MAYRDPAVKKARDRQWYLDNLELCKTRGVVYRKQKQKQHREMLDELKAVPCADCGNRYPAYVMDFHHVRGEKLFNVSQFSKRRPGTATLLAEVAKCIVLCSNCHRIRTYGATAGHGSGVEQHGSSSGS